MSEKLTVEAAAVAFCEARERLEPLWRHVTNVIKDGPGYVTKAEVTARWQFDEAAIALGCAWCAYLAAKEAGDE